MYNSFLKKCDLVLIDVLLFLFSGGKLVLYHTLYKNRTVKNFISK